MDAPRRPATGKQLLRASWALLRQDRQLIWLPALATVFGFLAAVILFVPGYAIGWSVGGRNQQWGGVVGGLAAAYASTVVAIYFQTALVTAANQRAEGHVPQLREVLRLAGGRRGRILGWATVSTLVGAVLRFLEDRLGAAGAIIGFLGGVAWTIASLLVVPVIVTEDLSPLPSLKRSSQLIRDTWGTSLRTTLRFGIVQLLLLLPGIVLIVIGVAAVAAGSAGVAIGIVLIVIGVVALLAVAMVFNAIASYARALLYRYAVGLQVPGIAPDVFAGALRPKRGRTR